MENQQKKLDEVCKYRILIRKQKNRCPICNDWLSNGERLELDHIIPKAKGGEDTISNKQLLHYYCHMQKTAQERSKGFK